MSYEVVVIVSPAATNGGDDDHEIVDDASRRMSGDLAQKGIDGTLTGCSVRMKVLRLTGRCYLRN